MNINPGVEVQGQYTGGATQELFTIGEIDKVWVIGDLYEMDLSRVQIGAPAAVTSVAYKDKVFKGQGRLGERDAGPEHPDHEGAHDVRQPRSAAPARDVRDGPDSVEQKKALAIPRNALLRLGEYKVVFVQVGEDGGLVKFERCPSTSTRARRASGSRSNTASRSARRSS